MIIHTIRDRGSIREAQEEKALGRKEGRKAKRRKGPAREIVNDIHFLRSG